MPGCLRASLGIQTRRNTDHSRLKCRLQGTIIGASRLCPESRSQWETGSSRVRPQGQGKQGGWLSLGILFCVHVRETSAGYMGVRERDGQGPPAVFRVAKLRTYRKLEGAPWRTARAPKSIEKSSGITAPGPPRAGAKDIARPHSSCGKSPHPKHPPKAWRPESAIKAAWTKSRDQRDRGNRADTTQIPGSPFQRARASPPTAPAEVALQGYSPPGATGCPCPFSTRRLARWPGFTGLLATQTPPLRDLEGRKTRKPGDWRSYDHGYTLCAAHPLLRWQTTAFPEFGTARVVESRELSGGFP